MGLECLRGVPTRLPQNRSWAEHLQQEEPFFVGTGTQNTRPVIPKLCGVRTVWLWMLETCT